MSGYTPVFRTVFEGSLFGKYPDTAAWLFMLALADKYGVIDTTPEYIAGVTGMPVQILLECIERFLAPDPRSRTPENEGRRLVLLEPEKRDWGWQVVNHRQYREKARLESQNASQVADGRNADKVRRYREKPRNTRRHPQTPATPADTPSDSDTNTNKEKKAAAPLLVEGLDLKAWERWERYRAEIRKPIKPQSMEAAQRKLAGFGTSQSAVVENSIAEGYIGLFPGKQAPKPNGKPYAGPAV